MIIDILRADDQFRVLLKEPSCKRISCECEVIIARDSPDSPRTLTGDENEKRLLQKWKVSARGFFEIAALATWVSFKEIRKAGRCSYVGG